MKWLRYWNFTEYGVPEECSAEQIISYLQKYKNEKFAVLLPEDRIVIAIYRDLRLLLDKGRTIEHYEAVPPLDPGWAELKKWSGQWIIGQVMPDQGIRFDVYKDVDSVLARAPIAQFNLYEGGVL